MSQIIQSATASAQDGGFSLRKIDYSQLLGFEEEIRIKVVKLSAAAFAFLFVAFSIYNTNSAKLSGIGPPVSAPAVLGQQDNQGAGEVLAAAAPCGQYGDVDGNGSVTDTDSQQVLRYVAGLSTSIPFTEDVKKRADVNGNLRIESTDSLLIMNYTGGIHITFPVCVDHDVDGFSDAVENYIGTDPYKACGVANSWPADILSGGTPNSTNAVTLQDITSFIAPARHLDTSPGDVNYNKRWDIVPGKGTYAKDINMEDLYKVREFMNKTCSTSLPPLMTFSVSKTNVAAGETVNMIWAAARAVTPCDASSAGPVSTTWRGHKQLKGTEDVNIPSSGSYTFTLTCYGPGGKTVSPPRTVTAANPCSGTPVLQVIPTSVEKGKNIELSAGGLSNCASSDVIRFDSTTGGGVWDKPLVNCNLGLAGNGQWGCSASFTADWSAGGPYSVRALLDKGGNGSIEAMSNMVNVTVTAPAPPPPQPAPNPGGEPAYDPSNKESIGKYIEWYVGGRNVTKKIWGIELNYGQFLYGMAGCESGWTPSSYAGPSYYEKGLYQYQARGIAGYPDSPFDTWGNLSRNSGLGSDIWNYKDQVRVTGYAVSPEGADNPGAWSCWKNWYYFGGDPFGQRRDWSDFIGTWGQW